LVGAVAQLGERLNGIQEVVGSIPISSTLKIKGLAGEADPFFVFRIHGLPPKKGRPWTF
jgi:hypothetical protein